MNQRRIHCLNKISKVGLNVMPKHYHISEDLEEGVDGILVRSAVMHDMDLPKSLLCIARAGAGVNNIPLDKCAEKGIVVFNTPGANANAVKELTIAMMLLAARDIRGSMEWVKENRHDPEINKSMEKAKSQFAGTEILGKTLGVIGCGAIGALVADAASHLGMKVIAVEPSEANIEKYSHLLTQVELVDYDELYERADYITLHVPLLDATRGMLNEKAFNKMKDGVIIINAARDALVNDDDLEVAIRNGKVRRYVTDFPNSNTAKMNGVVAISHLGASTEEAEDNCAVMAVNEISDYLDNGNIVNSVNFPNLHLGVRRGVRAVVLHDANKKTSEKVLSALRPYGVGNSVTGVKGNFGATLVDLQKAPAKELESVPGVIRVMLVK